MENYVMALWGCWGSKATKITYSLLSVAWFFCAGEHKNTSAPKRASTLVCEVLSFASALRTAQPAGPVFSPRL